MYKIANEQLPSLFAAIAGRMDLYMPLRKNGQVNYGIWSREEETALDALNTVKSPKDFFFPQSENLYTCYREGKKISITPEELADAPFAIFGIRGCDVKGIEVLDKVFLADPVDKFYEARRNHGVLISMACHEPEETCFCKVFGVEAQNPAGDVTTWMVDGTLYWRANTEKGGKLTEELAADGLLACGTCTFICPTCQCYDIRDYNTGNGIQRFRCWDSCMYSDFTLMAHGNIRNSQKERFRQRFMHKLVYFPENNDGMFSCVGCGRCVSKCPSSLNIVKVIKSLGVSEDV